MKSRYFLISLIACCGACNNIEDVAPSERETFIRFYESSRNLSGIYSEQTSDGYIILAREIVSSGVNGIVIQTDRSGNEISGTRIYLPGFLPTAMRSGALGYYITGDRVKFNPAADNVFDLTVTSAMLYHYEVSGDTTSVNVYDTASVAKTDFHGSSVTIGNNNEIILLGTFKRAAAGALERPFITAFDPTTMDTVWTKRYDVLERDYVNGKAVHATADGNIIWASALLKEAGDISRTYLSVPFVKEESTFLNNDIFGENTDQELLANDLQPAETTSFGYGLIGTFALPTGRQANMFFIRIDKSGNFIQGSERFFDGELSAGNQPVQEGESASEDTGDAITSTADGGFILAGSFITTPNRGNGGRDILLIKVDALGNVIWNKIVGGEGDESVSSIRETSDGSLLICGSNNVSGLSSIFILKTDKNGELKN
jgi:hypothetical protein